MLFGCLEILAYVTKIVLADVPDFRGPLWLLACETYGVNISYSYIATEKY